MYSVGGCLALHVASSAPDLVRGLVLLAPAPAVAGPGKIALLRNCLPYRRDDHIVCGKPAPGFLSDHLVSDPDGELSAVAFDQF